MKQKWVWSWNRLETSRSQRVVGVILGRVKGQKEQLSNRVRFISKLIGVVLRCASWRVHVSTPPVSATWVLSRAKTVLLWRPEFSHPSSDQPTFPLIRGKKAHSSPFLLTEEISGFKKFWRERKNCRTNLSDHRDLYSLCYKKEEKKRIQDLVVLWLNFRILIESLNSSYGPETNYYRWFVRSIERQFIMLMLRYSRCIPAI